MATNLTSWLKDVFPGVPGCPRVTILDAVLWTARDFCDKTLLWEEKLANISAVAVTGTDISFSDDDPDTINSVSTDFDAAGFAAGQIIVTNSEDNPGPFKLAIVAANTLTLVAGDTVTTETAGSSITVGAASYTLSSSNGDIVSVDHVNFNSQRMTSKSEDWLDRNKNLWRITMEQEPRFYMMGSDRYLQLVYCPDTALAGGVEVWVNLKPLTTAITVEDWLYGDHRDVIAEGSLARLLRIPRKPWTDMKMAEYYRGLYERDYKVAGVKKLNGYTQTQTQVKMRKF